MRKIDFNDPNFTGFEDSEDILIDSGILLAYTNEYDAWHNTVDGLFQKFILNNENSLFLYINPRIIDEVTHLSHKPLELYNKLVRNIEANASRLNNIKNLYYTVPIHRTY